MNQKIATQIKEHISNEFEDVFIGLKLIKTYIENPMELNKMKMKNFFDKNKKSLSGISANKLSF